MPLLTAIVPEVVNHIYEPIANQVIFKLLDDAGIRDTFENNIMIRSRFQQPSVSRTKANTPRLKVNYLSCVINPAIDPRDLNFNQLTPSDLNGYFVTQRDILRNRPVFFDLETETIMTEQIIPAQVDIEMSFNYNNFTMASDAYMRIMSLYFNGDGITSVPVLYDYQIPSDILKTMYAISRLNNVSPAQFVGYLDYWSNSGITLNSTQYLQRPAFEAIVQKSIDGLPVNIAFGAKPEDSDRNDRFIKFDITLTVSFGRPNSIYLQYPIVVNNQLVPEEYLYLQKGVHYLPLAQPTHELVAYNNYDQTNKSLYPKIDKVHVPWYDDWTPPKSSLLIQQGYTPFLIEVVTLDEKLDESDSHSESFSTSYSDSDSTIDSYIDTVIDLKGDLGDVMLHPELITLLQAIPPIQLTSGLARFGIEVFANDTLLGSSLFSLDDELNLTIKLHDPKRVYRFVIYELVDKRTMQPATYQKGYQIWCVDKPEMLLRLGYYRNDNEKLALCKQQIEDEKLTTDDRGYVVDNKIIMKELLYGRNKDLRICYWDLNTSK